ncbi:TNF receptor-associated factor 3-like isoform X3 [Halichondria panicea]|uniref:TNF receptor-associated factor 3-like isoform X3 n=1 Tax=Halichondria panicea TaxID=6063 RepID=UPI00312BA182
MAGYKIVCNIVQNSDMLDKYTCPHCHHLCKDAVQSVCGHWLCESCADELMATSSPKCPQPDCQEDLKSDGDQCFPDRFVRKEISKMMVLCPYKDNGCQWEDKTAALEAHLKTCTFASNVTCPLASLGCQHSQTGTKQELQKHIAECGPEHLQLMAGILSLLRPLLPSAISSESASVVERDGVLTSKGSKTKRSALKHDDYGYQSRRIYSDEASTAAFASVTEKVKRELDTKLTTQLRKKDEEIDTLVKKVSSLERAMKSKQAEYEDRDFRLSLIENSSHDGQMIWKIPQFSQRMADAQSGKYTSIFSLPFHTGKYGYKMCLRLYILGDGIGKNTHMSLFFVIMKGEFDNILQWPFTSKVTFKLINQTGNRDIIDSFKPDPMSSSFQKPKSDMNIASGCPRFVSHTELKSGGFIVEDTLFIKSTVDCTNL